MLLRMPIETKQISPQTAVVTISGRLISSKDAEGLETMVKKLLDENHKMIVIDISAMEYSDSSGIGAMVSCLTHAKKNGGDLRLAGANPRMQRLFKLIGAEHIISMYPTVAEATEG